VAADYERGLELRKKVMGDEYVERALAGADQYTAPQQELVTECAWGAVWSRPGLEPRIRSMITVAMLTALNRQRELKAHLAGALRNGVTRQEISEILLHSNVYCGAPAAMDAFRTMSEVFAAADAESTGKAT
jgi:4-carboxymuconolactone decarboxylase